MTIKNLDSKLVSALINNGRESLRGLGEQLDVSVTTVSNHLNTLTEEGAIKAFTPVIDYSELGYDVTTVIQLKVEGEQLQDLTERLEEQAQMVTVYETTGDYDVIAIGRYRDTDAMNDQIKALLSDGAIEESNTSVVLNAVKENEQFELHTEND